MDWSPVASAGSYSAFAAVLAGFVFTGIVVLISQQSPGKEIDERRYRTLRLFLAALLVFGLDSYLFALMAGEAVCLRAWAIGVVAGGLLGLGSVLMFAGLGWLLHTFAQAEAGQSVMSTIVGFVVGIAAVVAVLLPVNVAGYWRDSGLVASQWISIPLSGYTIVTICVIVYLGIRWRLNPVELGTDASQFRIKTADRWLRFAVITTGAYAVMSVVGAGILAGIPGERWRPAPFEALPWLLGIVATLVPTAVLVFQVLGMPPRSALLARNARDE